MVLDIIRYYTVIALGVLFSNHFLVQNCYNIKKETFENTLSG